MELGQGELENVVLLIIVSVMLAAASVVIKKTKTPQHNSILTGNMYYEEIMDTISESRFLHVCRMDKTTFIKFVEFLKVHGELEDSKSICAGEKVMIFMSLLKVM
jgi:hypothetical protein